MGMCAFTVPPAVLGEVNVVVAAIGALTLTLIALSYPVDRDAPAIGSRALVIAVVATPGFAMLVLGFGQVAVVVALLVVASIVASRRSRVLHDLTRGIAVILGALTASYFVTMLIGFPRAAVSVIQFGQSRSLEVYLPFTFASAGPPLIEGTRRFSPLIGEPGLIVFFLVPLLAAVFSAREARNRLALLAVVVFSVIASQSLATILLVAMAAACGLVFKFSRLGGVTGAVLVALPLALTAVVVVNSAVVFKSEIASESVTDRALGGQATSLGNINLVVAVSNNPLLAGVLITGLVVGIFAIRSVPAAVAWVLFASVAAVAQPSQWQIGGWLLLGLVLAAWMPERPKPRDREALRHLHRNGYGLMKPASASAHIR